MRRTFLVTALIASLGCRGGEITLDIDLSTPEGIGEFCDQVQPEVRTLRVDFEASPPGCPWEEDDNLPMRQAHVTARVEQYVELDLPEGVVVCDMSLNFTPDPSVTPTMEYDDNMFFLYNRVVLAASYAPMVDRFTQRRGLPIYNWTQLAGMEFGFDPTTPTFCLGEAEGRASCEIPPPETMGAMRLQFDDDLVDELSFRALELGTEEFGFVVIGDNDPRDDCRHESFSFDVTVGIAAP